MFLKFQVNIAEVSLKFLPSTTNIHTLKGYNNSAGVMGGGANICITLVRAALFENAMRPLSPFWPPIPYI